MLAVWGGLGIYVADLELLLGLCGRSWAALGASIGSLGCTWAALGAYVGDLGPLLGLYWRSWAALGAAVCGPGPLLEPMLAVLGRSWDLCWRSWAALGAYVGGLEPKTVKNLATLKMCLFPGREHDLRPRGAVWDRYWSLCWRSWAALGT